MGGDLDMTALDRQNVRQAAAAYFGGGQVADDAGIYYQGGPLTVYGLGTAAPYLIKGSAPDQWFTAGQAAGAAFGAVMSVHLDTQPTTRIAIGGPASGWRQKRFRVRCGLEVISYDLHLEAAETALDTLLGQWEALLYQDRTLGTSGNPLYPDPPYFGNRLIQEAGERPYGYMIGSSDDWFVEQDRGRAYGGIEITFDAVVTVMG
jgi:hypothetical protein